MTTYREHPLGLLVSGIFQYVVIGIIMAVLAGVFDNTASLAKIACANALIVFSNAKVANFHHMHIWVSFGPVLERFVISPAQQQVHHSTAQIPPIMTRTLATFLRSGTGCSGRCM